MRGKGRGREGEGRGLRISSLSLMPPPHLLQPRSRNSFISVKGETGRGVTCRGA